MTISWFYEWDEYLGRVGLSQCNKSKFLSQIANKLN